MRSDHPQRVLNRWKSIEGHAGGVRRMIENDQSCLDVLRQTLAIRGAIASFNALILERYVDTCATAITRSTDPAERERVIDELLHLLRSAPQVIWNRDLEAGGDGTQENVS